VTEISELEAMVMDADANDYEEFEQIMIDLTLWASEDGIESNSELVLSALKHLVGLGLADAYELGAANKLTIARNFEWKLPTDLYFYRSALLGRRYCEGRG
jgi:hypothetical protein